LEQERREDLTLQRKRTKVKRAYSKLKREAAKRRNAASKSHQRRSKRGLDSKDHDTRGKINLARVTGKNGVDGKRLNQLEGRLELAQKKQKAIKMKKNAIWGSGCPVSGRIGIPFSVCLQNGFPSVAGSVFISRI
jgi:hypothetical protein